MIVIDRNGQKECPQALAATIGFFDGVHLGHRFLIDQLKKVADERGLPSAVITFRTHPRAVLHADYQPKLLNTWEEKLAQLATTGVDYCLVLDFTLELSRFSAAEFITKILAEAFRVKALLIGYDHRFGHDRAEGFDQYVVYGKALGMEVIQALPYDNGQTKVSSSEVRRLLAEGEVKQAAVLLSYPYSLKGKIVKGHQVGRTIGFPTANLSVEDSRKILPGNGVYAVWAVLSGKRYKGMLSIGNRPTLDDGNSQSIEVYLLDFSGDLYGKEIEVSFVSKIRDNRKFPSLLALKSQLEQDRQTVSECLI
ncbi:MAG TPA: bifunctional riboflavin kinase/FAD synthetase [Candidatus Parabacteroides faecavium]|nr:bifunctional riboflavin kinase/FAD synthetase [Candidatus Parabacteroides faecavium]